MLLQIGNSNTLGNTVRRSTGIIPGQQLTNEADSSGAMLESRTLPRQLRPTLNQNNNHQSSLTLQSSSSATTSNTATTNSMAFTNAIRHQRTTSAISALSLPVSNINSVITTPLLTTSLVAGTSLLNSSLNNPNNSIMISKNEHKLQYFDLDVANAPPVNRQSINVGNLNVSLASNSGGGGALNTVNRIGLTTDAISRVPMPSSVVYNSVDFVKTEAFKRIREERKKENEGVSSSK